MKNFDTEFENLEHYIRVITDRIWEGRRFEDIPRYYGDPCVVETPSSVSTSVDEVIAGTKATLGMFPDRRLLAEDVIESGDEEGGFLSSHRIISPMTHRGDGLFGPATGRKIHVRTIADCVCKDNLIIHEWLVRDQAAIALQIGLEPRELAQTWLNQRGGWNKPAADAPPTGYRSHLSTAPVALAYARAIEAYAQRQNPTRDIYDEAVHHIGPGGITRYGQLEVQDFWQNLFGALRVNSFEIEHLAYNTGSGKADRVALRWRADTQHDNSGFDSMRYGPATGRHVELMGINHVELVNGKVVREWVLIDDVAVWMQVLLPNA